ARELGPLQPRSRARGIALVEDEIDDLQYDAEPIGSFRRRRHLEPDARALDALLGAADALGHRGFRNKEGIRYCRRGQAADRAKREGQLRGHAERWMAAEEHECEGVVLA